MEKKKEEKTQGPLFLGVARLRRHVGTPPAIRQLLSTPLAHCAGERKSRSR